MAQLNIQLNEFRRFFISLGPYNTTLAELNREYKNPLNLGDAAIAVSGNFMFLSVILLVGNSMVSIIKELIISDQCRSYRTHLFSHRVLKNIDR